MAHASDVGCKNGDLIIGFVCDMFPTPIPAVWMCAVEDVEGTKKMMVWFSTVYLLKKLF